MPVLRWLSRLIGSTMALATNLVVSLGLFLLSAHIFGLGDADAEVPAYIVRGLAAVWLVGAVWHYVKHGVLQRPKPAAQQKVKIGASEGLRSSLGCLSTIGVIALTARVVGGYADWVYAGLVGDDPTHPAQQALDGAARQADAIAQAPERLFGYGVLLVLVLVGVRVIGAAANRGETTASRTERPRDRMRRRRDKSSTPSHQPTPPVQPTATSGATPRGGGHVAHPPPSSAPRTSRSGRTIDDPLLGTLHRDDAAGGWRLASPRQEVGKLLIVAGGEPSHSQMETGRSIVQRSFEALLRASEAARSQAQAHGVGLPRFTIIESVVRDGDGPHPVVTIRLHCEGDKDRVYEVTSTDGMQTFRA